MTMALKYLLVSLLAIAALAQDPAAQTSLETSSESPDPDMPKRQCGTSGYMCSDCNNQAVCIGEGDGTYKQIENVCPPGSHCVENQCVQGAKCNFREFACSDEGFFPDPYKCNEYHVCVRKPDDTWQTMNSVCTSGSYDASTASCGYPMNSTACIEGPVPLCTTSLQIGVLKSDPSIYYLCTDSGANTGPQLYKCAGGKIFDTKKVSCVAAKIKK